jgi:hypothetical protein
MLGVILKYFWEEVASSSPDLSGGESRETPKIAWEELATFSQQCLNMAISIIYDAAQVGEEVASFSPTCAALRVMLGVILKYFWEEVASSSPDLSGGESRETPKIAWEELATFSQQCLSMAISSTHNTAQAGEEVASFSRCVQTAMWQVY